MIFLAIWLIILVLIILSFVLKILPIWIPVVIYLASVAVRLYEVVGNYNDWKEQNINVEKEKLGKVAEDMANRGLALSGFRAQEEAKVRKDFEHQRNKEKRKFYTDLINTLFLK